MLSRRMVCNRWPDTRKARVEIASDMKKTSTSVGAKKLLISSGLSSSIWLPSTMSGHCGGYWWRACTDWYEVPLLAAAFIQYEIASATSGEAGRATSSSSTAVPLSTNFFSHRTASIALPVRIARIETTKASHLSTSRPSRTSASVSM
eukprot:scaffold12728_cov57-Phaeocystis_antarctica.AAC.3